MYEFFWHCACGHGSAGLVEDEPPAEHDCEHCDGDPVAVDKKPRHADAPLHPDIRKFNVLNPSRVRVADDPGRHEKTP